PVRFTTSDEAPGLPRAPARRFRTPFGCAPTRLSSRCSLGTAQMVTRSCLPFPLASPMGDMTLFIYLTFKLHSGEHNWLLLAKRQCALLCHPMQNPALLLQFHRPPFHCIHRLPTEEAKQ